MNEHPASVKGKFPSTVVPEFSNSGRGDSLLQTLLSCHLEDKLPVSLLAAVHTDSAVTSNLHYKLHPSEMEPEGKQ